jgi:hypothetical protein
VKKSSGPRVEGCDPFLATVTPPASPLVPGAPDENVAGPGWATAQVEASMSSASALAVSEFMSFIRGSSAVDSVERI